MKTPEQIKEWLEDKPWYSKYKAHVLEKLCYSHKTKDEILSRMKGKMTFLFAFSWKESDEGFDFWHDINNQFQKWLHDDENTRADKGMA